MPRTKRQILEQIDSLQSELRSAPDDSILIETDDPGSFIELRYEYQRGRLLMRYTGAGTVRPDGTLVTTRQVSSDQVPAVAEWINSVLPPG